MGLMDDLRNVQPRELGGTGITFIDADTLTDGSQNYRIQGINSAEVEKVIGGQVKQGTAGGAETTSVIHGLANEQGYTKIVKLTNPDGTPQMDAGGRRQLVDLIHPETGKSFKTSLLEANAFDETKFTSDQDRAAAEIAAARRHSDIYEGNYTANAFDQAASQIAQAERAEGDKLFGFKKTALDEKERANYVEFFISQGMDRKQAEQETNKYLSANNVQIRKGDRDINNNSTNPFSDSWEQGWTGVGEAAFGVAELLGAKLNIEDVERYGSDGIERQRGKLGEYGRTILDYKEVVDDFTFSNTFEYLGNNFALSIPYMAATIGATLAAPFTYGASYSIPVALYTGNTWNEMEGPASEKSAAWALASGATQAALDKLGLDIILPKGVAPKKIFNAAVDGLVKHGFTRDAAKLALANGTRREIAEFAGVAQQIAKDQIKAKAIGMDLLKRASTGALGEAATEAAQEATAYLAAVQGSEKQFDWNELNERLISASIAGGTLGGGISSTGAVYNAGAWADVAYRLAPASDQHASDAELFAAEEQATHGRIQSIEELTNDASNRAQLNPGQTLDDKADAHAASQAQKGTLERLTEKALNVSSLWQGATRNIFTPDLKNRSRALRILSDTFGGSLQRTFSGSTFENAKHHRVAVYKNMIRTPENLWRAFAGKDRPADTKKNEISKQLYDTYQKAVDVDGNFDPNLVPENTPNRGAIISFAEELRVLGDKLHADQAKHNPKLGYIKNYLSKYKALDKGAVERNKAGFTAALIKNGYTRAEATELVRNIINNPQVNDIDAGFSVTKGGIVPSSHRKRQLGISEKAEFQEFLQQDIFANVSEAAKSAARYTAHRDYIGKNGEVISRLLDDARAEGIPEAEINKIAAQMKDYLDAESGNYKRPTTDLGQKAADLQKSFSFYTTLSGLPLATISSFVETMLIHKGLRNDQIFGEKGSLQSTGKELANVLWRGAKNVATLTTGNQAQDLTPTQSKDLLQKLGYYEWDVGAATVTGVSETNANKQKALKIFFELSGLTGFTNFTRAARASIGLDYINDKTEAIFKQRNGGQPRTREIQEAEEALRNLGIDVDGYLDVYMKELAGIPLDAAEAQLQADTIREGTFNFVNDAIALPQSANRPLIYQDPRFALFTQFQGFIATFTANHIPKLWGEYVKRGTPAMKYNAFALMTTMIMMGFVSQHLKDLIKYGGTTPHLDDPKYIQRGVRASGLLGSGERLLDQFFPLYEQRSEGGADWIFNGLIGESPALGQIERLGTAAGHALSGEGEKAIYYGLKSTPVTGPLTNFNKTLAGGLATGEWNFGGDN